MMFYSHINPVLAAIGSVEIRFYGLVYAVSFILLYFFLVYLSKQRKLGLTAAQLSDLVLWLIIGLIVGARAFYVIFYNLRFYLANPLEIAMVWHGGMSFHGGLVGLVIIALIFCRKHKIKFYGLADIIVIPAGVFLMLGRIANFINGELYGRITSVPWAVKFHNVEGFRHPSQIYESFKNLVIFSILWFVKDIKKLAPGFIFWLFISLFGLLRFLVEFLRMPDSQLGFVLGNLSMGQILSLPMFAIGMVMLFVVSRKREAKIHKN
ncbi:prolipoprotein diacylglyceryl transferase [Candidatus Woesearchaeota archaeon]|nr:prolipoprotein diacylglyceryl transferase [Candidatus Woesearchaeota archaeon]